RARNCGPVPCARRGPLRNRNEGTMSFARILRLLIAIFLSGAIGWISLFAIYFIKISQQFETLEATQSDGDFVHLARTVEEAVLNIGGGSALFLAAGIAGV